MVEVIQATFENGVFKPDTPPSLSDSTRVRLFVETVESNDETRRAEAWTSLQELWQQSRFDSQGDRLSREQLHARR